MHGAPVVGDLEVHRHQARLILRLVRPDHLRERGPDDQILLHERALLQREVVLVHRPLESRRKRSFDFFIRSLTASTASPGSGFGVTFQVGFGSTIVASIPSATCK